MGLIQLRDVDEVERAAELDEFAYDLVAAVNAVHTANFDLMETPARTSSMPLLMSTVRSEALALNTNIENDVDLLAAADSAANAPGMGVTAIAQIEMQMSEHPYADARNQPICCRRIT